MTSTTDGRSFLDIDEGSDEEMFESFGEHEASQDGLLQQCISQRVVDNGMILTESSVENLSVNGLEPYTGMTFPSLDDARDFYYEYAKRTGFTIRTNRIRHSLKSMAVIGRDFVCSREGFRAAKHSLRKDRVLPPRPVTREGCKAMIRLASRDGGKWVVTKFVQEHNHKLMTHCKFLGELPTINILSELFCAHPLHTQVRIIAKEEKDKKIRDLSGELQRERERSASFQQQLCMILKDLKEHEEFVSLRVEDIIKTLKEIELGVL
ncbi:hypothetical protein NC651_018872 [Populus alba x Populus x berolinensis]|nr:hypothetical protein NC651_018872 [Populus alba x Populus x berolinensis]